MTLTIEELSSSGAGFERSRFLPLERSEFGGGASKRRRGQI